MPRKPRPDDVPRRGENRPGFVERQLAFAAHIRHPELNPRPEDVEPRRMRVYVELFYNNIENLLASVFPVAKSLLGEAAWHRLVRDFVHRHRSESPYFLEVSQEFLAFLGAAEPPGLPPFLLELCHYEWVELAVSVADEPLPGQGLDPDGDLLTGVPVVSPLIWRLAYRYPVHEIGPSFQPTEPPASPTQLVVYRRRDDTVHFMEVNVLTMALLEALESGNVSGAEALDRLADAARLDVDTAQREGAAMLERLRRAEIVLGTLVPGAGVEVGELTE